MIQWQNSFNNTRDTSTCVLEKTLPADSKNQYKLTLGTCGPQYMCIALSRERVHMPKNVVCNVRRKSYTLYKTVLQSHLKHPSIHLYNHPITFRARCPAEGDQLANYS